MRAVTTIVGAVFRRATGLRGHFVTFTAVSCGLNALSALLMFCLVDPIAMGYWTAAQMVTVFLDASRLGVLSGLARELPYELGRGRADAVQRLLGTALGHTIATIMLGFAVAACVPIFVFDSRSLQIALSVASLSWALGAFPTFVRVTVRSDSGFARLGRIELVLSGFGVASVPLVAWLGFTGILVRAILLALISSLLFFFAWRLRARPQWDLIQFWNLFKFGRHTFLTGYLLSLGQQAERVMLLGLPGGVGDVGLYAPVLAVWFLLQTLVGAILASTYPQMLEQFGRDHNALNLLQCLQSRVWGAVRVMVPISVAVAVAGFIALQYYLDSYRAAAWPLVIACVAGPLLPCRLFTTYFLALKRWPEYYLSSAIQACLPYALIFVLLKVIPPFSAVAIGAVGAVGVTSAAMTLLTLRHACRQSGPPAATAA